MFLLDLTTLSPDASSRARESTIRAVGDALAAGEVLVLRNHGLGSALLSEGYGAGEALFSLPSAAKAAYARPEHGGLVGFVELPPSPDAGVNYEEVEMWHVNSSFLASPRAEELPPNVWPKELPGFRAQAESLYRKFQAIVSPILEASALYLGWRSDALKNVVDGGWSTLRFCRYPDPSGVTGAGEIRVKSHQDVSLFTLLPGGSADGLQVLSPGGQWRSIPGGGDQIVMGAGRMLEALSGGTFRAFTHRVVHLAERARRISLPFFVSPRPEILLQPVEGDFPIAHDTVPTFKFLKQELGLGAYNPKNS